MFIEDLPNLEHVGHVQVPGKVTATVPGVGHDVQVVIATAYGQDESS